MTGCQLRRRSRLRPAWDRRARQRYLAQHL